MLLSFTKHLQCDLLHDFAPLEHRDRRKSYAVYNKKSKKEIKRSKKTSEPPQSEQVSWNRYYGEDESGETSNVPKRVKLGQLPSYIPL